MQVQVSPSLLTQGQHLLSLQMGLRLLIQQVGDVCPTAHVQALSDPLRTYEAELTP